MPESQVIKVREMRPEDYDSIIAIWERAGLSYRGLGRDSRENIANELVGHNAVFLVAEVPEGLVGIVLCTHDGRKGWINRLAVIPSYQGRGVGHMLVQEAERRFEKMGLKVFSCLIMKENSRSQEFFTECGYSYQEDVLYFSKKIGRDA
jgi:N-acetylglutamate synthase